MNHDPTSGAERDLPHPALKAILLCDQVIRDARTNKLTLVGIFDDISSAEFPFEYVRGVAVYALVTDAAGPYEIRMEIVRFDDERSIGRIEMPTDIADRLTAHDIAINISRIRFERPGRYEVRLFANGRFLGATVLLVEAADGEV